MGRICTSSTTLSSHVLLLVFALRWVRIGRYQRKILLQMLSKIWSSSSSVNCVHPIKPVQDLESLIHIESHPRTSANKLVWVTPFIVMCTYHLAEPWMWFSLYIISNVNSFSPWCGQVRSLTAFLVFLPIIFENFVIFCTVSYFPWNYHKNDYLPFCWQHLSLLCWSFTLKSKEPFLMRIIKSTMTF